MEAHVSLESGLVGCDDCLRVWSYSAFTHNSILSGGRAGGVFC